MADRSSLHNIDFWRMKLGLFPVRMFGDDLPENRFVLLNGNQGNFCLDLTEDPVGPEARDRAWSSNVGHYVSLLDNHLDVRRWDSKSSSRNRFSADEVRGDLEGFHSYLERDQPKSNTSIVAHVIRVFRSLRTALDTEVEGPDSLRALLYLLACVTDGAERGEVDFGKWGLETISLDLAKMVSDSDWTALSHDLGRERVVETLKPDLTLILRHASGQVFQEAHYEAVFVPQRQLLFEAFPPEPVIIRKNVKKLGLHFTPPALARTLVEECLGIVDISPDTITIFDPACGSGEFLRETLRQLKIRNYQGRIKLIGYDVSVAACDMAKFVLAWESRGYEEQVAVTITRTNSIGEVETWPRNVDIVIMNPPFVSWQDMEITQREQVSNVLGPLASRRPDLSGAFVLKAIASLGKDGVLGCILPASFLDGTSSFPIRKRMREILSTRLVARLGSHLLFPGAMIDAALYVGSMNVSAYTSKPTVVFWADYRRASNAAGLRSLRKMRYSAREPSYPVKEDGYSIYLNPQINRTSKSWAPRPYDSWQLLQRMHGLPKVKDLFDVKQGTLTGLNEAFILSKEAWHELPKKERRFFRPAVINKSVKYGYLIDSTYVFYPHGDALIETEGQLKEAVKTYYKNVLSGYRERLLSRERVNPEQWWRLSEHRAWQIARTPKLVSTYFGDAGSFAWDASGDFVVVQGYGWVFKPTGKMALLTHNLALAYLTILNSPLFSELLSATSNHVGGGQWNLSKRFVNDIAIPNLMHYEFSPELLSDLSDVGARIYEGRPRDETGLTELVNCAYEAEIDHSSQ